MFKIYRLIKHVIDGVANAIAHGLLVRDVVARGLREALERLALSGVELRGHVDEHPYDQQRPRTFDDPAPERGMPYPSWVTTSPN